MRKQLHFVPPSSRFKTDNSEQQSKERMVHKKSLKGKSQFIKSKFDMTYEPQFRPIKINKSPYFSKQELQNKINDELAELVQRTREEVKKGKKIIIDWSYQNNFRTTRFPNIGDRYTKSKVSETEVLDLENPKHSKYMQCSNKFGSDLNSSTISSKREHLSELISSTIFKKHVVRSKLSISTSKHASNQRHNEKQEIENEEVEQKIIDPHYNYAIIEEMEEKSKRFFQSNNDKIKKAIDYERNLSNSLETTKKKIKLDEIQERIINKSKLALLKSDLIRKFKEIKESVLETDKKTD